MTASRLVIFGTASLICLVLIAISVIGLLSPFEDVLSVPLSLMQQAVGSGVRGASGFVNDLAELQSMRQRVEELERVLIYQQEELVELREMRAEYERLAALQNYASANRDWDFTTADVIGRDTSGLLRTININRGTRDGIAVGMPVVTDLGLVGRVYRVTATGAQVQLITDVNSFVSARAQTTRTEGSVAGTDAGGLEMVFIPRDAVLNAGDSVVTSGLAGNFPRGIIIGQILSFGVDDSRLHQRAELRSLIDFDNLEMVQVITNFEPVDVSDFATPIPGQ
jgi:rod shape-determining protein MreC